MSNPFITSLLQGRYDPKRTTEITTHDVNPCVKLSREIMDFFRPFMPISQVIENDGVQRVRVKTMYPVDERVFCLVVDRAEQFDIGVVSAGDGRNFIAWRIQKGINEAVMQRHAFALLH